MPRRFKEARLQNKIKLIDAAKLLGVAHPTLSAWEGERKEPRIESIKKMADLYGVSIEYLLGYDSYENLSRTEKIPIESISIFHGKPVWTSKNCWALVNAIDMTTLFVDGNKEEIYKDSVLYFAPPVYAESELRTDMPLTLEDIYVSEVVWIEPISQDQNLRNILRGRYSVKCEYVENTTGSRFHFDSYGATWLAYGIE